MIPTSASSFQLYYPVIILFDLEKQVIWVDKKRSCSSVFPDLFIRFGGEDHLEKQTILHSLVHPLFLSQAQPKEAMFNLCKWVGSFDCTSRVLAGFFSTTRLNQSLSNLPCEWGSRTLIHTTSSKESEMNNQTPKPTSFLRNVLMEEGRKTQDEKLDMVHIKIIKNNTFVTITDSKGNKKTGASSGCLEEMKGGPKVSRYAAEATAEHVGRMARNLGLKSVVVRVNGFTHFKKKKQAILAWREGFTHGRGDRNPIAYIEDSTRRPHNGCRLPKRRRV